MSFCSLVVVTSVSTGKKEDSAASPAFLSAVLWLGNCGGCAWFPPKSHTERLSYTPGSVSWKMSDYK